MPDAIVRGLAAGGRLRGLAAVTTELVEEARRRHGTFPTATAALGRALTAALLLGATLKGEERISLQFNGDGPLQEVFAEADAHGRVRGYVRRPGIHLPSKDGKLDVGGALGRRGTLQVLRWMPEGAPYQGVVPLVAGEIAQDLAYYLTVSEQIPSTVALGVYVEPDGRVTAAGGFIVQRLPANGTVSVDAEALTPEEARIVERVEANLAPLPGVSALVREGATARALFETALAGLEPRVLAEGPAAFFCPCSRERVARTLVTLGPDDLERLAREQGGTTVTCHFCNTDYRVGADELRAMAEELRRGGEPAGERPA
ncbi:MAG TPA: Hsp33 family molecular chaperone HslO [Thermodesulfobacteriota bacterium]|nr:Hsp33 family molecular chaperone HslO [Thermodesulfobacteriota bacterium]